MNKEIESIINYYINNDVARDKVGDYIEELQQENNQLKEKVQYLKEKIENHYKVFDKDLQVVRDIKYNDIAILMDRSSQFPLYKKILAKSKAKYAADIIRLANEIANDK